MSLLTPILRTGGARLHGLFRVDYPPLALEIDHDRVSGVIVERGRGGLKLVARATKSLPPGLIEVGMVRANVQDARLLGVLVADLVAGLDRNAKRASLVLSDKVAKVSIVALESTPRSLDETRDLLIWKLKKATPFRVEEGRLSFQSFPSFGAGTQCLTAFARESVVAEYEEALSSAGLHPGLVDFATFNVFNLYHDVIAADVGQDDALFLNLTGEYCSSLIVRGMRPLFYRCKILAVGGADLEQVMAELHPTLLYYQDRLQGLGLKRVYVRAAPTAALALTSQIQERHGFASEILDPGRVLDLQTLSPDERYDIGPALGAAMGR